MDGHEREPMAQTKDNLTSYPKDLLAELFRRMVLVREFELRAIEERRGGLIPGFIHSCVGQEATAVGACLTLEPEDVITSTHRGHGHLIGKGGDPRYMMAVVRRRKEIQFQDRPKLDSTIPKVSPPRLLEIANTLAKIESLCGQLEFHEKKVIAFFADSTKSGTSNCLAAVDSEIDGFVYMLKDIPGLNPDRTPAAYTVSDRNAVTAAGCGNFVDGGLKFFPQQVGSFVKTAFQKLDADVDIQLFGGVFDIQSQHGTGDHVWLRVFQCDAPCKVSGMMIQGRFAGGTGRLPTLIGDAAF